MLDFLHVLFDTWNSLTLCGGRGRVPTLSEDLDGILCEITASQAKEGVMQSATLVDGHCMRHTFRVRHNAQEHDSLDRHVHGEHVERRRSHHGGRGRLPKQLTARFRGKRLTHAKKFTFLCLLLAFFALLPAVGLALLPAVGFALLPAVGFALLNSFSSSLQIFAFFSLSSYPCCCTSSFSDSHHLLLGCGSVCASLSESLCDRLRLRGSFMASSSVSTQHCALQR